MEDRIVNGVVDRLFNRLNQNQEPDANSTPVSLPNVIQRIVSNPALAEVEGELRNRFNTRNPQPRESTSTVSTSSLSAPATISSSLPLIIGERYHKRKV